MTASGYTTNPKRIIYIPKSNIKLSFKRDPKTKLINMFSFEGVDFSEIYGSTTMSQDAEMFLEIRNRQDFQREKLGKINSQATITDKSIKLSGNKSNLTWHLFVRKGFNIIASNEDVKAKDMTKENKKKALRRL